MRPKTEFVMGGASLFLTMAGSGGYRSELKSATGFASSEE